MQFQLPNGKTLTIPFSRISDFVSQRLQLALSKLIRKPDRKVDLVDVPREPVLGTIGEGEIGAPEIPPSQDIAFYSGYNSPVILQTFTGKQVPGIDSFTLANWCPENGQLVRGARPGILCPQSKPCQQPGLYSGKMRTVIQRMNGYPQDIPFSHTWANSNWIFEDANGDDWLITCSAAGMDAAPMREWATTIDCDGVPQRVYQAPDPVFIPIQLLTSGEVAAFFAQGALYNGSGWAANSLGDTADNLAIYTHADTYYRVTHWRIQIFESNPGVSGPDTATINQLSENVAWSAFAAGTIYPSGSSGTFMLRWNSQPLEPAGHPHTFPIVLYYDGDTLEFFSRTETVAGPTSPLNETYAGPTFTCSGVLNFPADPAEYETAFRVGDQGAYPTLRHIHASIPAVPNSDGFSGTTTIYKNPTLATGEIITWDNIWTSGRADDLYQEIEDAVEIVQGSRSGFAVPNGDREAVYAYTQESTTIGEHTKSTVGCLPAAIGAKYDQATRVPCDSSTAPPDCPDCYCAETLPNFCQGYIQSTFLNDTGLYGSQARYVLFDSGIPWGDSGKNGWCIEEEVVSQIVNDQTVIPETSTGTATVTLIASGGVVETVWTGSVADADPDWLLNPNDYDGNSIYLTRTAEGNGAALPRFGDPYSLFGVEIGTLEQEYDDTIATDGLTGFWVGVPKL